MAQFSFTLSDETIELGAQGESFTVDPRTFHANALEAIFIYGVRRWFQDNINSAAHTFRKAKEAGEITDDFDVKAAFATRLEAATSGQLSTPRTTSAASGLSAFDEVLYTVAVEVKAKLAPIGAAWNESKGLPTSDRKSVILAAVNALPDDIQAKLRAAANVRHEAMAGLSF